MQKKTGVHFYINIANFDDVAEKEEAATHEVRHSIHALDTFFSSVEAYGMKHYPGLFLVERLPDLVFICTWSVTAFHRLLTSFRRSQSMQIVRITRCS